MAYQNIQRFAKPHTTGEGGSGNVIYIGSGFDGGLLNVTNINASNIDTNRLTAKNIEANAANIKYIMSKYGEITKIEGDELNYGTGHISNLDSTDISTNTLTVKDTATIENIINNNLQSKNIVTDYLTVNKSAHFFELVIDKIRSVQGTQINTAANCIVDFVEGYDSNDNIVDIQTGNVAYYRIYWKNTDDDGRSITNDWLVYDQALCESFNVGTGVSYDVSNKYYWRLVTNTDNGTPKYVNLTTGDVQTTAPTDYVITFSNFVYGDSTDPQQTDFGDFIVESQVSGEWDDTNREWTVGSTQYGLQITTDEVALFGGDFQFTTDIPTQLNIGVYYDDSSFDYHPASSYETNYIINTNSSKNVEAIVIVSAVIDKYDACNWIDLSNIDMDATVSGKSAIPSAGDNVCQLGYRYDQLVNPTQDDIARASAIIIAAYKTPDANIVPPSYAQYQNVGADSSYRWDLGHYRGSYFDAERAKFIGEFEVDVNGNKVSLDQYIQAQTSTQPAEILIEDNNAEVNMCILQVDSNDQIHDLNNFPGWTDGQGRRNLNISIYTQQSYSPQLIKCDLFGRTVTLLDIDPNTGTPRLLPVADTANGIYIYSVTTTNNKLRVTFDFRGTDQTISNGSAIEFYGQVVIGGTTYYPSRSITIASVKSVQGTDGELFLLNKITEESVVKSNKSLNTLLRYSINHIVGTSAQIITPTTEKLIIERYNVNNQIIDYETKVANQYDSTHGYWEYTDTMINWYDPQYTNNKPYYYVVKLCDAQNNVLYNTIVRVQVDNISFFSVTDELTTSVQGNSNSISQISQSMTGINMSVTNLEIDIDDINNGLQTTGIDITNGIITLDAATTVMTGDFDLQGHFIGDVTSENPNTLYKTVIDTTNGGIKLYGPDTLESGATQQQTLELGWGLADTSDGTCGYIKVMDAAHPQLNTEIVNDKITINGYGNTTSIYADGINWQSTTEGSGRIEMSELLFRRLRVAKPNTNWYNATMTDDMITSSYNDTITIDLPDPLTSEGKFYFIKHKKNKTTYIRCTAAEQRSESVIMNDNSTDVDWQRNIQDNSTIIFCDGSYWILMELDY